MNIFADENIPQQIVTQLRAEGHQVEYVMQQVEDRILLANAYKQQAILITSDKDFGRLVLDEGKPTAGVLLLRVSRNIPIRDRARILVNVCYDTVKMSFKEPLQHLRRQSLTFVVHHPNFLII
jgi:predicted nuclease of predicted toxin-antitoxin system